MYEWKSAIQNEEVRRKKEASEGFDSQVGDQPEESRCFRDALLTNSPFWLPRLAPFRKVG
jgi:hypothetical protein